MILPPWQSRKSSLLAANCYLAGLPEKRHAPVENLRVPPGLEICIVLALLYLQQCFFNAGLKFFLGIGALDLDDCGTLVPFIQNSEIIQALPASRLEVTVYLS